jgi:hypothetical protein
MPLIKGASALRIARVPEPLGIDDEQPALLPA